MREFYLDNAATTKMDEDVFEKTSKFLYDKFYNPSAVYLPSVEIKRELNNARDVIKNSLGVDEGELVFTGSATEANNTIIFSQKNRQGKKYLFGAGEHPSVLECAKQLKLRGYDVEFLPLNSSGSVDINKYKSIVEKGNIAFVSIQHVSNETGVINPIAKLVKLARKYNKDVLFHSDGVQAFMKFDYSLLQLDVDFYTVSAHKIYGPKGVGAFYVKKGLKIQPYIFGGGQEFGYRSGTENVFGIISFAECVKKLSLSIDENWKKVSEMRASLLKAFESKNIEYVIHGAMGVPHTMNIMLSKNIRGETLVHALEKRGVYMSTGSACSATKNYNSTLESMGVDNKEILSSVRISFSQYMDFNAEEVSEIIKEEIVKMEGKKYE